jgi:hypothetical protein
MNNLNDTNHGRDDEHHHRDVTVFVNDLPRVVRRGRWLVADLKTACNVLLADDLEIVENGQLRLLRNEDHIVIHGDEHFVAHPATGGAS